MTDAKLLAAVKKQVEFYFSDSAYRRDNFLKTAVANDPQGFVPIATLLTFNKLKQLTTDAKVVAEALKDSESVIVSEDQTKLKRSEPLPDVDDSALRTLYVKGYPRDDPEVTIESVREQFSVYGPINYVKLRRETGSHAFKGTCFIEFSKEEDMQKAYKAANEGGSVQLSYKGTPLVQVIPFSEWHASQNASSATGKRKQPEPSDKKTEDAKNDAAVDDNDEEEEAEEEEKVRYEKGLLVEIEHIPADTNPVSLREFLSNHAQVAYAEKSGETKAVIRLKSADDVSKLEKAIETGLKYPEENENKLTLSRVSEEAEKEYYSRLHAKKENGNKRFGGRGGGRGGRGGRGRGRGRGNKYQRR